MMSCMCLSIQIKFELILGEQTTFPDLDRPWNYEKIFSLMLTHSLSFWLASRALHTKLKLEYSRRNLSGNKFFAKRKIWFSLNIFRIYGIFGIKQLTSFWDQKHMFLTPKRNLWGLKMYVLLVSSYFCEILQNDFDAIYSVYRE